MPLKTLTIKLMILMGDTAINPADKSGDFLQNLDKFVLLFHVPTFGVTRWVIG